MNVFPLLLLPLIPIEYVVLSWENFSAILLLTFGNKRLRRLLTTFKYPVCEFSWNISSEFVGLLIRINTECDLFFIKFEENEGDYQWNVDGYLVRATLKEEDNQRSVLAIDVEFMEENKTVYDAALIISRYLLEILKPKEVSVVSMKLNDDFKNCFVWSLYPSYNHIFVGFQYNDPVEISIQQLKYCLEEITTSYMGLVVSVNEVPHYKYSYEGPARLDAKINNLIIGTSDWVDFDKFFDNFNSPEVYCVSPTTENVNKMLKNWINGTHESVVEVTLRSGDLQVEGVSTNAPYDFAELTTDVDVLEVLLTNNQRQKLCDNFCDPELQFDIQRNLDGRRATLFLCGDWLKMTIWTPSQLKKYS